MNFVNFCEKKVSIKFNNLQIYKSLQLKPSKDSNGLPKQETMREVSHYFEKMHKEQKS